MEPVFILNKRMQKRKMARRAMGILLSVAMAFQMLPAGGLIVHASQRTAGLGENTDISDVAKVVNGGTTTYVKNLCDAFTEENSGAQVTLLADVDLGSASIEIKTNCTYSLDLGGHIVGSAGARTFSVFGGDITISDNGTGGTVQSDNIAIDVSSGTVSIEGGTISGYTSVNVEGGTVKISGNAVISGSDTGLHVTDAGKSALSGGTFRGIAAITANNNGPVTLKGMLTDGYAYHQNDIPVTKAESFNGQVPLDSKGAYLFGTVTVKKCGHNGEGVCEYTHTPGTTNHQQDCLACGKKREEEKCSFDVNGNCPCGAVLAITLPADLDLAYNGTAQEPAVTVIVDETTTLTKDTDYSVAYDNNTNAGKDAASVMVSSTKFIGTVTKKFTIQPATPVIVWENTTQELAYTGSEAMVAVPKAFGPNNFQLGINHDTGQCQFSYAVQGSSEFTNGLPTNAGAYIIRASVAAKGNYAAADSTNTLDLTIQKAAGTLTVPETSVSRKFGDAQFLLNCSTNGDGKISYASSDEDVISVSADGMALIKGTGTAVVTVSLAEGMNYTGGAKETATVKVEKADAPSAIQETRNYTYASGSNGAVSIGVAEKFPPDRGETNYTVATTDEKNILSGVSVDGNGTLTFTVPGSQAVGAAAFITVTAEMENYEDAAYIVEIVLVDKMEVKLVFTENPQDSVYDGRQHNGYLALAAQTINVSYTGGVQFWYEGTGGTHYSSSEPPVRAGSYMVTASVPENETEYTGVSAPLPFAIQKALIKIKADDKAAQAGSPLPELTYTVSGLAEKESLAKAPELACNADMGRAGSYTVTAGGAEVPGTDNYQEEIIYENGTLTVFEGDTGGGSGGSGSAGSGGTGSSGSAGGSTSSSGSSGSAGGSTSSSGSSGSIGSSGSSGSVGSGSPGSTGGSSGGGGSYGSSETGGSGTPGDTQEPGDTQKPGDTQEPEETGKPQEPEENAQVQVKSVTLSKTVFTYTGKAKKPAVIAIDTKGRQISGKYYTVSYKNNKKVGKAFVVVKFKNGYSGTVKKSFTIRPAGTAIKNITAAPGGFTVKWKKKTAQTSGYQVQYATDQGFKGSSAHSVFVKKASLAKKEIKNLQAGKKYYVRIRTYKTAKVGGKNTRIYSAWSGAIRVRTLPSVR